jgi:hypothetical protein
MRSHIFLVILDKFSSSTERRQEALTEYLLVTLPNISKETAAKLAGLIPDILPELYSKWIDQFVEKLFETIPDDQLQHLCSGSVENNAALSLVFLMFMESERMERQMEDDLRRYALQHSGSGDMGDLVAAYLRGKVEALREEVGKK